MTPAVARRCVQHLLFSIWRKKPLLLAIIMVSTLLVLAFQYHTVQTGKGSASVNGLPDQKEFNIKQFGSNSVNADAPLPLPRRNLSALSTQSRSSAIDGAQNQYAQQSNANQLAQLNSDQFQREQKLNSPGLVGNPGKMRQMGAPFDLSAQKKSDLGSDNGAQPALPEKSGYVPNLRLVHLDLKGAPPKISYFKQIFPLLKSAGANGILLEYEDTFPFWGVLKPIASPTAYSQDDLRAILDLAKLHNFEVIPLVQTFGHLELALKLSDFRHLREVDTFPMAICPSKNDSFNLVAAIIDQVMTMHPSAKWLHVGCDEVFHLGYCDKCRQKDRDTLYIQHVSRVARYVRDKHSVIPIIWDDMLRNIAPERMKEANLGALVEPMIWTYVREVYRFIPYSTWLTFADVFPHVWAASAFKGAFGETLTVPNVKMHLENNEAWLEVMAEQHKNFKSFRGIAITGWQRYDHLATLCETLPAGLPSLVVDLITVSSGKYNVDTVFKKFDNIMQCSTSRSYYSMGSEVDLEQDPYLWQRAASCSFPGSSVFRLTQHVADAVKRVNDYIYDVTIHKAWMTDYNVRHNISNPYRVDEGLQDQSSVYYTLTSLVRTAEDALKEVFDKYTTSEWIEQNIYPYILNMEKLMKNGVELKKARVWPRRPLPPLEDLKRFGVGTD